ncbi:taste receptor type 2 member 1-like [Ambystoma mexicanum]|uniref:taste receptor type 2 member 1-like n=1 Tax=Ambystoma mexicanum TaxID=8296 RepID=UPI0037E72491
MELSASAAEIIACSVLIAVSLVGNALLIYCTWRCIIRRLPTSFALIFSLAVVHLAKNLVVNVMNIVFSAGVALDAAACKVGRFTAALTTVLAIWFTLYLAVFYCTKLNRVVHPLSSPPNRKWRKHHLLSVFGLWVVGVAVCCPILLYGENKVSDTVENGTYQNIILLHDGCEVSYGQEQIEMIYGQIFLVVIDLLPLALCLLVCFRTVQLFLERKRATYGDIYIGEDASEAEVLRASKLTILLTLLVTVLWVAHFALVHFLEDLKSFTFFPAVLAVFFSGYSALSPYLMMLINYKVRVKLRSMRPFCCPHAQESTHAEVKKPIPKMAAAEDTPCT